MATRRVDIRVSVDDIDAGKRLDAIAAKLDKLTKKVWTIRVRLDDGGAGAKLDKMAARLDKMSKQVITPKFNLSGVTKADAEVDKLTAKFDKLSHKRVTVTVHTRTTGGKSLNTVDALLGDIFGGGGGGGGGRAAGAAAGAGGGGALSALAGANNSTMGAAIAGLIAYAMSIGPAIIPFGLGGLVGGGGALLAGKLGTTGLAAINADKAALAQARAAMQGARGNTPLNRVQLRQAQHQLALDQAKYGGFVPFGQAAHGLQTNLLGALLTGVAGTGPGFSAGPHGQPGGSFLSGLTPILAQIGTFLHTIGPGLGNLFRASLPSLAAFVKIGEQFAKAILPAMTQSLKALGPSLPILVQGFKYLSQGIAGFIIDLGPGMKDAAIIFKGSMIVVKGILQFIGVSASALAYTIVKLSEGVRTAAKHIPIYFDKMRHETAVIFDGVRHDIASYWDDIWQNTIGRVSRGVQDVMNWDMRLRHGVASDYDLLRHYIASEWDQIWQDTIGKVERGISTVEGWFRRLPSGAVNALRGLGSTLWHLAETWLSDLLHGAESMGSKVEGWFKGLGSTILHALGSIFHFGSPSRTMFQYGQWIVQGLEKGIQSRMSHVTGVAGSVASMVAQVLKASGKPMSWLPAITRLVSLESGGNPRAVNPIQVLGQHAEGMFQMLPSTFAAYGGRGSLFNWLGEGIAAMKYISAQYGSPFNIPGLFGGGYQGYAGGGVITEPIFGMGLRSGKSYGFGENGIHERVTPLGAGGGGGNVYITVQGDTDPDGAALRIVQKLRKYKTRHGGGALGIA